MRAMSRVISVCMWNFPTFYNLWTNHSIYASLAITTCVKTQNVLIACYAKINGNVYFEWVNKKSHKASIKYAISNKREVVSVKIWGHSHERVHSCECSLSWREYRNNACQSLFALHTFTCTNFIFCKTTSWQWSFLV